MSKINIYGLGSSTIDAMTVGVLNELKSSNHVYTRTMDHPAIQELETLGVVFTSFDEVYETHEQFEDVYEDIVNTLINKSAHEEIIYVVPGHPYFYETTTELLLARDVEVEVHGGASFIDTVITSLNVPINTHFQVLDASTMKYEDLSANKHTLITQVYDQLTLGEAKLTLLEYYTDEMIVTLVDGAGSPDERIHAVPLFELDHLEINSNLLALYVPVVQSDSIRHRSIEYMNEIFDTLVDDEKGCPWDKTQTHESLQRYLIEESYEFIEAIENGDDDTIVEELGDVLLQVALHSAIGKKNGYFDFYDVLQSLNDKVIRRHPHIFGDEEIDDLDGLDRVWKLAKQKEGKVEKVKHEKDYAKTILPWMKETIHNGTSLVDILKQHRGEENENR